VVLRFMGGVFLWLILTVRFAAAAEIPLIPRYEVGDVAVADLIAPVAFAVPNPEETKRLQESEVAQAPLVFRFHSEAAAQSGIGLTEAIAQRREQFLANMEKASRRKLLDEATVNHPSFARFVAWCQEQDKGFPLTMQLARNWALGQSDEATVIRILEKLHCAMDRLIVAEAPDGERAGRSARIIPVNPSQKTISAKELLESGKDVFLDEIQTIAEARKELEEIAGERHAGKFVGRFLRPNCSYDPAATRAYRDHRLAKISTVDFYQAGDLIVTSGETVDERIIRASEVLEQKRIEQDQRAVFAQARRDKMEAVLSLVDRGVTAVFSWAEAVGQSEYRYPAAISVCLVFLLWVRSRRKRAAALVPALAATRHSPYAVVLNRDRHETIFVPLSETHTATTGTADVRAAALPARFEFPALPQNVPWEEKVLAAEKRAEDLLGLIRAGLAPHLAKYLMGQFVRELLSQRYQLLKTQEMSETELSRLESQFAVVQSELVERLNQYELRTSELEKELAVKRSENQELIRTVMGITKNQQDKTDSGTEVVAEREG